MLEYCEREKIGFIPWYPLASGSLANSDSPLSKAAKGLKVTPNQLVLAWLLKKSPVMLPIPGTSKVEHLESNTQATLVDVDDHLERGIGAQCSITAKPGQRGLNRRRRSLLWQH